MRTNTMDASRRAQTSSSRCTIREFDDDHLVQELKQADVFHSETASGVERYQPAGMTCVPLKQQDDQSGQQGQQGGQQGGGGQGGGNGHWNDNQPKGESAEGHMSYMNGSRSHPMCVAVDDRRVRPYGQKEGEGQFYSPDGCGQTIYHRRRQDSNDGLYILTLDDQQQQSGGGAGGGSSGGQTRMISIRHANKKKQRRTKQQTGQSSGGAGGAGAALTAATGGGGAGASGGGSGLPDDSKSGYKHEGDSINTEVQLNKSKINFNDGGGNVGFYDSGKKDWLHHDGSGAMHSMRADKNHSHIKHDGNHVWVDQGNCYKSKPFVVQPDPCS